MFPISMAPGPHSSISEEFLQSIILRPKKPLGSWNLLSMNEAWMDECAARLQPLVDQYKPRQHQTFEIILKKFFFYGSVFKGLKCAIFIESRA